MIQDYLTNKKEAVIQYFTSFKKSDICMQLSSINSWGNTSLETLFHFASQGKMLRAGLVFLGYESASKNNGVDVTPIAASLELMHSGVLIHDDIFDEDETRRNMKSIYKEYQERVGNLVNDSKKTGESLAYCVGNIGYFLGMNIIANASLPEKLQKLILSTITSEFAKIQIAQMTDVYGGSMIQKTYSKEEILSLYRLKTGRYTCSLPLVIGAMIAQASPETINTLWTLGEELGIVYQMVDDELNIFGDPKKTGKPIGSDIRENKQTLMRYELYKSALKDDIQRLNNIYGNQNMTPSDLLFIQQKLKEYTVRDTMQKEMQEIIKSISNTISTLTIEKDIQLLLLDFVQYISTREK